MPRSFPSLWSTPARVALIAPSGAVDPARYQLTVTRMLQCGLVPLPCDNVLARHRYLAGTIEARLDDLYQAYACSDADLVWCLRGGYGAAQLLPRIDWSYLSAGITRPLVGYSDNSALLNSFYCHGLSTIHGPVATELALTVSWPPPKDDQRWLSFQSVASAWQAPCGQMTAVRYTGPPHTLSGALRGGNLTTLASLCGTQYALELNQPTLLMLEEVNELDFRVERCFHQLLSSLDTQWLQGICLGSFSRQGEPTYGSHELMAEWLAPLNIPLYYQLPIGHQPLNQAWPYGAEATLSSTGLHWQRII